VSNALWLVSSLPLWYLSALLVPLSGGVLTAVPAVGAVCLLAGTLIGLRARRRSLLLHLLPFALTEALMVAAGLLRGEGGAYTGPALLSFLLIQAALLLYVGYRTRDARVAGALLTIFSGTYALFGASVASMAISDTWL
jgi:hypothetical protein